MDRKYTIYGEKRIESISKKLNLPYWWVESVFVEYFPCRRFFEDGELWTFDFDMVPKNLVEKFDEKKIVMPGFYIAQNIQPKDLGRRTALANTGSPIVPIDKEIIYPEGKLNDTAFPFLGNHIVMWDFKLNPHSLAVVRDGSSLYQWNVGEVDSKYKPGSSWTVSDIFDSAPLWDVYEELKKIRTRENFDNPTSELKKQVAELYEKLEGERQKIREKIWEYHLEKKKEIQVEKLPDEKPPHLTEFDTITLEEGKYKIHTYLEPFLYRSALKNYKECKKFHDDAEGQPSEGQDLQEMESSLMTIISSAGCLESYINLIIRQKGPEEYQKLKDVKKKWNLLAKFFNNTTEYFDETKKPFSDFINIVNWRNKAMHNKFKFSDPVNQQSGTFATYNVDNAKLAVLNVREMITELCTIGQLPMPNWLGKSGGSGGYWDDTFQDTGIDFYENRDN